VGGFTLTLTMAATEGARSYADRLIKSNFDPTTLLVAKDSSVFSFNGNGDTKPQVYDPTSVSLTGDGNFRVKRLTKADVTKLKAIDGVASVHVQYNIAAQYVSRRGVTNGKNYTASLGDYTTAAKPELVAGTLAGLKPGTVMLPEDYIKILGFISAQDAIGKAVQLRLADLLGHTKDVEYRVAAVIRPPTTSLNFDVERILVSDADAEAIYAYNNEGSPAAGQFMNAIAKVTGGDNEQTLLTVKDRIVKAGFAAQTVKETQESINQIIQVLQAIILVFGLITLIASFFGVVNTQYISVLERTREIGLMKALGMRRSTVSWLFIIEATWIGFIGALIGAGLAIGLGTALNPFISDKIKFGTERLLLFRPMEVAGLIVFLMIITTIAGLLPAWKAARLDPIEALRTE
jgi:putative ABC transport system permease protein